MTMERKFLIVRCLGTPNEEIVFGYGIFYHEADFRLPKVFTLVGVQGAVQDVFKMKSHLEHLET